MSSPARIVDYDPKWPDLFQREHGRIRAVLGGRAFQVEHAGSTSVPGLAAKPVIDIALAVADSADESAWVPGPEAAGYSVRIREPEWHEHRMLKGPDADVNLHVFPQGCGEIDRMLIFRDWLRENEANSELYERTKLEVALREWQDVQDYADAKTAVVTGIMARARSQKGA